MSRADVKTPEAWGIYYISMVEVLNRYSECGKLAF